MNKEYTVKDEHKNTLLSFVIRSGNASCLHNKHYHN